MKKVTTKKTSTKKVFFILSLAALATMPATAQRNTKAAAKTAKPAAAVATVSPGEKLFRQMLESTAKVMFVDSVVVDKADFLARVPLNAESGTMAVANPKADFKNHTVMFQNELADRRIVAQGDSTVGKIYTQELVGTEWTKPAAMPGLGDGLTMQNYPFLANDGVTLYFSACGEESMGGRDIFMTSFDSDEAEWYKPQNLGLPFSSTANDYLLAIDDLDTLAWLVTDRRQPEGKVCIYTFVPTATRASFDGDTPKSRLEAYARITSIRDTWGFGDRAAALRRRDAMIARQHTASDSRQAMRFVVSDNTVVTDPAQFRSDESRQAYQQVNELEQMTAATSDRLDTMRRQWHNGDTSLGDDILKAERDLKRQQQDLRELQNKIRAEEQRQAGQMQ